VTSRRPEAEALPEKPKRTSASAANINGLGKTLIEDLTKRATQKALEAVHFAEPAAPHLELVTAMRANAA